MIYLIGGAPRTGKSILGQQLAAKLKSGWISTDLLVEVLRVKDVPGGSTEWDAAPEAIAGTAEWFFPCLERFIWGVTAMTERYVIEGVGFLPTQVGRLAGHYPLRAVFLGCSQMTPARFDRFPGRSRGYATLPQEMRRRFAADVPRWSEFVRQESERHGYPYVDMSDDFSARLREAEMVLLADVDSGEGAGLVQEQ